MAHTTPLPHAGGDKAGNSKKLSKTHAMGSTGGASPTHSTTPLKALKMDQNLSALIVQVTTTHGCTACALL
jgi:hypothetical protein